MAQQGLNEVYVNDNHFNIILFFINRTVINNLIFHAKLLCTYNTSNKKRLIFSRSSWRVQTNNAAVNDHLVCAIVVASLASQHYKLLRFPWLSIYDNARRHTKRQVQHYWPMEIYCRYNTSFIGLWINREIVWHIGLFTLVSYVPLCDVIYRYF